METFFLDEHKDTGSWTRVWEPICTVIRKCLEGLHGMTFDPASPFRIYCHRDNSIRPDGCVFLMQMHLPKLYSLDTHGWGVTHSRRGDRGFEFVKDEDAVEYCRSLCKEWLANGKSKCWQPKPVVVPIADYLLVLLQMPGDSVIKRYSPVTVDEFVVRVGEWARQSQTRCVVKPHPSCKREAHSGTWAAIDRAIEENAWLTLRQDNIHSLLANAAGVWTINSGSGFEALVHGKPVVTFGAADYDHVTGKGTLDALDDAANFVRSKPDPILGQKFAMHYILQNCFWIGIDKMAEARICAYLRDQLDRAAG